MTQRASSRPTPGANTSYQSMDAMSAAARFIVTLKSRDGLAVVGAWVSVHLEGSGLLRPEGAYDAKTFTFQRTNESGVIQFTWLPGQGCDARAGRTPRQRGHRRNAHDPATLGLGATSPPFERGHGSRCRKREHERRERLPARHHVTRVPLATAGQHATSLVLAEHQHRHGAE